MGKCKPYNKRITMEIDGKQVPRHRVVMVPVEGTHTDGTKLLKTSDRVYIKNADGSLRSLKNKISKKDRKKLREAEALYKEHSFPIPPPVVMEKCDGES